jgi:hypothetical protein
MTLDLERAEKIVSLIQHILELGPDAFEMYWTLVVIDPQDFKFGGFVSNPYLNLPPPASSLPGPQNQPGQGPPPASPQPGAAPRPPQPILGGPGSGSLPPPSPPPVASWKTGLPPGNYIRTVDGKVIGPYAKAAKAYQLAIGSPNGFGMAPNSFWIDVAP